MAHLTGTDLNDIQFDILWQSIASNTELPYTTNPYTNKSLNTTAKQIIKSINEVLSKSNATSSSFNSFTGDYNNIMGDFKANSQLQTDLEKVDANLILSLLKIYKELHGEDLDNQIPLPAGKTVAELLTLIQSLNKEFIFSDLTVDSISLGTIKANQSIDEVVLIIDEEFDNGLQISLGTDLAQGLLMTVDDNCTDVINQYSIECNQTFTTDTEIKLFLFNYSGLTKGKGKVIIKTK